MIDHGQVGLTPWEGRLPLGEHVIEVSAKGFISTKRTVQLERRKQREVTVALDNVPHEPGFSTARKVGATVAYGTAVLGLGRSW